MWRNVKCGSMLTSKEHNVMYQGIANINLSLILLSLLCATSHEVRAQTNSKEIELKCYYKYPANVFISEYDPWINLGDVKNRFTPNEDEIKEAESIFLDTYNAIRENDKRFRSFKKLESPRRYFYKWRRNYIGYVNSEGHRIILMYLINFNRKMEALKMNENLGEEFVLGFGEWYEQNQTEITVINLTTKKAKVR